MLKNRVLLMVKISSKIYLKPNVIQRCLLLSSSTTVRQLHYGDAGRKSSCFSENGDGWIKLGACLGLLGSVLSGGTNCYLEGVQEPDVESRKELPVQQPINEQRMRLTRQLTSGIQGKQRNFWDFVIVGVGTTCDAAIEGILQIRPDANILVLSKEVQLPRMDVWRKQTLSDDLMCSYNEWRRHVVSRLEDTHHGSYNSLTHPLTLLLYRDDLTIDIEQRQISLGGERMFFDKALLAMPGVPRDLYVLASLQELYNSSKTDRVNALQEIGDFELLDTMFQEEEPLDVKHITVIGGGFLGTEMALALSERVKDKGIKIVQLFAEKYPLQTYLPQYLCKFLRKRMKAEGIDHVTEKLCTDIGDNEASEGLTLSLMGLETSKIETDYVVLASTHVNPEVDVAKKSGLEIDSVTGGIMVNSQLEAASGIYAAGSCASFYDRTLGRRRTDRFDHSINSGFMAGLNMALSSSAEIGASQYAKCKESEKVQRLTRVLHSPFPGNQRVYCHQPSFKSSMKSIGVEIDVIGDIHADMKTIGLWVENDSESQAHTYKRGIVYFLKDQKIQGILLWNSNDVLDRARALLQKQPDINLYDVKQLKRQLPIAPDSWLRIHETNPSTA